MPPGCASATSRSAGGTDLLPRIKLGIDQPTHVVDLKRTGLSDRIVDDGNTITFGALTSLASVERSPLVAERLTALTAAAAQAATPQIRNRATLAGNLVQRPRCWYYRDPHVECWLKGGNECPARLGRNEHHAIFDQSPCVAVHPSDLAACLVALDATVRLESPAGSSTVAVAELFAPPTEDRRRETTLAPDQLISQIQVPAPTDRVSVYRKAMDRKAWAFALVGVAVVAQFDGQVIRDARIVLAGVANVPRRAIAAEQVLVGRAFDDDLIERAALGALDGSTPLPNNRYKQQLAVALIRDALRSLDPRPGDAEP